MSDQLNDSTKGIHVVKRNVDHIENEGPVVIEMQTEESSKMPIISPVEDETEWKPSISTVDGYESSQSSESNAYTVNQMPPQISANGPYFHVTYWMFYPYSQGKQMCTLSLGPLGKLPIPLIFGMCLGTRTDFGSHVGDWEHMTLYFKGRAEPEVKIIS